MQSRHELRSLSNFSEAYSLSTCTQQASLCTSSTYLRALVSQEDFVRMHMHRVSGTRSHQPLTQGQKIHAHTHNTVTQAQL